MAVQFTNLYNYITSNGIVIPITSDIKSAVENEFKSIFGSDLDVTSQTAVGRLIEAFTLLIVNFVGITAQNANQNNVTYATGAYLDSCGALFSISRREGESDDNYRKRILESQSRGTSFVESIRNAISSVEGVNSVCVLNNDTPQDVVLPNAEYGIIVPPHSIFISVNGGNNNDIANAIFSTKSAGCGYTTDTEIATLVTVDVNDASTGSVNKVYFYRPNTKTVSVSVSVNPNRYTGTSLEDSVRSVIATYLRENSINCEITPAQLTSAIIANIPTVIISDIVLYMEGEKVDTIRLGPNMTSSFNENEDIRITIQ